MGSGGILYFCATLDLSWPRHVGLDIFCIVLGLVYMIASHVVLTKQESPKK